MKLLNASRGLLVVLVFLLPAVLFAGEAPPAPAPAPDLKTLAEKGDAAAQVKLGAGLERDAKWSAAAEWYRKAAVQGNPEGQTQLGRLVLGGRPAAKPGEGVATNRTEGFQWFLKAANQDYAPAQFEAGRCLQAGMGTARDLVEAYKWYELALKKGYQTNTIKAYHQELAKGMKPEQVVEGKKRVEQFKPVAASKSTNQPPQKPAPPPKKTPAELAAEKIQLKGLSGPPGRRLAVINNNTFMAGETANVKIDGQVLAVQCVEIKDRSVIISVITGKGASEAREVFLSQ